MRKPVVLMYHAVVGPETVCPDDRENGARLYDVPEASFRRQMEKIKSMGLRIGLLDESGEAPDVVITFDDGEMNNFDVARPILREMGFRAYFFVTANRVGHKGYMDWEQLRELRDDGMVIGSHGLTHRILTDLKEQELEREFLESKGRLEKELTVAIDAVSIPRGFVNEHIVRVAQESGFKHIFTSEPTTPIAGCTARTAIKFNWSVARVEAAVSGHVPWGDSLFHGFKKMVKGLLGGRRYDSFRNFLLRFVKL